MSRRDTAWQHDPAAWPEHVAGYTCRVAIMGAARKHGERLGIAFRVLLVRRLMAVDVDRDGGRPDGATATRLVEGWHQQGVIERATGARREARAA